MQRLSHRFALMCTFAMVSLGLGCASAPAPTPKTESLLLISGFKIVNAGTDAQLKQIPTLPAGQITVITQTGKNYFVYPDLPKNRVFVGTAKEYEAYRKLRRVNDLPDVDPQASYLKQDSAMMKADKRDESVPWDGWPRFDLLNW
jgi:hypothetical protein